MASIVKAIDHNRYVTIAMGIVLTAAVWTLAGCPATVQNPWSPNGPDLTRQQFIGVADDQRGLLEAEQAALEARIATFNKRVENSLEELRHAEELRAKQMTYISTTLESAAAVAGVPAPWAQSILGLLTLTGVGAATGTALDNRRKDKVIVKTKAAADAKA